MGVKPIVTAAALAIGFGALWAAPGVTGEPIAAAGTQPKAAAAAPGRRICRNVMRSGTRLTSRYCHTQTEWDEAGEGARRLVQDGQDGGNSRDGEFVGRVPGQEVVGQPR
jgi:hypothetical protein